jgi:hypothetical protein
VCKPEVFVFLWPMFRIFKKFKTYSFYAAAVSKKIVFCICREGGVGFTPKNKNGFLAAENLWVLLNVTSPTMRFSRSTNYQRIIALPQVNPLPKAANTTKSPDLILPCSHASVNAIGIEAAVVFP